MRGARTGTSRPRRSTPGEGEIPGRSMRTGGCICPSALERYLLRPRALTADRTVPARTLGRIDFCMDFLEREVFTPE